MTPLLLLSACPTEVATDIARQLVQQKLAACINIIASAHSIYRWHDAVEEAKESILIIKTSKDCYDALEAAMQQLHPYENPEIIALPITHGAQNYIQWLLVNCKG